MALPTIASLFLATTMAIFGEATASNVFKNYIGALTRFRGLFAHVGIRRLAEFQWRSSGEKNVSFAIFNIP